MGAYVCTVIGAYIPPTSQTLKPKTMSNYYLLKVTEEDNQILEIYESPDTTRAPFTKF